MAHSLPPHLSASSSLAGVETSHRLLAAYEDIAQKHDILLTPTLLLELHAFLQRNRILGDAATSPVVPEEDVCPHCLKAHLLANAAAYGLSLLQKRLLQKKLPGNTGHRGWYLDRDTVKKPDSF